MHFISVYEPACDRPEHMNTGMGLALGSWASILILVVASFVVYTYRMVVEESALLAEIGEPYAQFMRTRKRVIPYVY